MPKILLQSRFWWFAMFIWFAALYGMSSQSSLVPPSVVKFQDKFEHVGYFTAGGLCFCFALLSRASGISAGRLAIMVILFCSIVGASDEFHQSFTPGRQGNDLGDWLADTVGGVIAAVTCRRAWAWLLRRQS
jgi:VanZ family protein